MTTPVQPDPAAAGRFLEALLDGDPARLDVATDEQVDAMMEAADVEAPEPETVEQVLARAERRARERTMRAHAGSATTAKAPPRKAIPRTAWVAGALVAAAAAAVVAVEVAGSSKREPDAIEPDRPGPVPPPPTPAQQASRLRDEAVLACEFQDLDACRRKLDEAKALDPAGESEPRVVQARQQLVVPPPKPSASPKGPLKPG